MRTMVATLPECMASSRAITLDALAAANRISLQTGLPVPFEVVEHAFGNSRLPQRAAELIIVPGLGAVLEGELNTALSTVEAHRLIDYLRVRAGSGAVLAASCASSFLLAESGCLDGRRATTSWWFAPLFARRYPKIKLRSDEVVIDDNDVVTGGAALAQMDVMMTLIARFAGIEVAQTCARYLLLDHRQSQARFVSVAALALQDEGLARAERWVRNHLGASLSINEVASVAGLAPRTFARRLNSVCGLSPSRFVQRIRIEAAIKLLETSRIPVDEVAHRVGYSDASTLRRIMKRNVGRSPSDLRNGFQALRNHGPVWESPPGPLLEGSR